MGLLLTDDQLLLQQNATEVLAGLDPARRFRAMRDAGDVFDTELWTQLVELGWAGLCFPESAGGLGYGLADVAVILEALGAQLAATPMISAVGASVLDPDGGGAGGAVTGIAWREHARDRSPTRVDTRLVEGRVTGRKLAVLDGTTATSFVVSARDGDALRLVRVAASEATVVPLSRIDHRDAADVVFDAAPCTVLPGDEALLRRGLAAMDVALCAEWLGGASGVFERTKAWLHERRQFGVPIGSFQVLQHRAVDAFVKLELARSAVLQAAREPTPQWVDLARVQMSEAYLHVAKEAVQLHGGIGMTDECDVGFYLKRAMVAAFG